MDGVLPGLHVEICVYECVIGMCICARCNGVSGVPPPGEGYVLLAIQWLPDWCTGLSQHTVQSMLADCLLYQKFVVLWCWV